MSTFDSSSIPLPKGGEWRTLGEVRNELRGELGEGELATCPCCGQDAKVYSRPINATMVSALRAIAQSAYGLDNRQIIAATKQSGGGNVSLLQHWKLIEQWPGKVWRVTATGRAFLAGHVRLASRVILYNNIFLGFDEGETVTVEDMLGRRFSAEDLLNPAAIANASVTEAKTTA